MAGQGRKDFQQFEILTAADVNGYLMDQSVMRFADDTARSSAINTPSEGMVTYLDDSNQVEVFDGSSWVNFTGDITQVTAGTALTGGGTEGNVTLNVDETELFTGGTEGFTALSNGTAGLSYQPVSHNYVINGAFDIWQRGTSFSAANAYTADRWEKNYSTAFTTETISQQSFTSGELEVAGFGGDSFYLRQAITTVGLSTRSSIIQRIEDVRTLAGQTVTLTFYAKADSNRTLAGLFLIQDFGSGGSTQVATSLSGTTIDLTTSWQRFSKTVTLPSVSGKTIGSSSNLYMRLDMPLADGSTLDIWGVQLEAGSIATPFKRNANSIQGELAACQRYYQRIDIIYAEITLWATANSDELITLPFPLKTPLRSSPNDFDLNNALFTDRITGSQITGGTYSLGGSTSSSVIFRYTHDTNTLTTNRTYGFFSGAVAGGYLGVDAEI